jgi:hypothetical protein
MAVLAGAGATGRLKMGNLASTALDECLRRPLLAVVACCAMLAAVGTAHAEYTEFTFGGELDEIFGMPPPVGGHSGR